ncbi:MAG: sulfite exporter TauE/SafE family protein [SAR202 cluster bacterium]|nr:sulfite exporter TauE/SafE family protein [SAR202 cluster bacterium]
MIETILFTLGVATGIYGVLVGAGGGFILAPVLILFFSKDPEIAAGTSLALVSINSISGFIAYRKSGFIDVRSGFLFAIAAVPGSVLAPFILDVMPGNIFRTLFGVLLLSLAIHMFFRGSKAEDDSGYTSDDITLKPALPKWMSFTVKERRITAFDGTIFNYRFNESMATIFNLILGFVSSFFGTGGGFLRTPILVSAFSFPVKVAVATSIFSLSFYATIGAAAHAFNHNIEWYPTLVWGGLGLVLGGQIGARLAQRIKSFWILKLLLLVVLLLGLQLLLEGLWPGLLNLPSAH